MDGGYRQHRVEHAAQFGIDMEIARRAPGNAGFTGEAMQSLHVAVRQPLGHRLD